MVERNAGLELNTLKRYAYLSLALPEFKEIFLLRLFGSWEADVLMMP